MQVGSFQKLLSGEGHFQKHRPRAIPGSATGTRFSGVFYNHLVNDQITAGIRGLLFFQFTYQLFGYGEPLNIVGALVGLDYLGVSQVPFHWILGRNTVTAMYHHGQQG